MCLNQLCSSLGSETVHHAQDTEQLWFTTCRDTDNNLQWHDVTLVMSHLTIGSLKAQQGKYFLSRIFFKQDARLASGIF